MNKAYIQYINNSILFLKFIALLLLVTKLANFTDVTSFIEDIIKAKDFFFTSDNNDLQELILEDEDFPEVEVEIPSSAESTPSSSAESTPNSNTEPQSNKHLYTALKISAALICGASLIFGTYYCINYFANDVTKVVDVATKGLDESAKAITKANDMSLELLDTNKEMLESKKTELIKEMPKIKPKEFYIPPKR